MKKVKKYLALALAMGLMLSSMTVWAEEAVKYYDGGGGSRNINFYRGKQIILYVGTEEPTASNTPADRPPQLHDLWSNRDTNVVLRFNGSKWIDGSYSYVVFYSGSSSSSAKDSLSREEREAIEAAKAKEAEEKAAAEEAAREAVRLQSEAEDAGFADMAQMQAAQAENKTAGEYYNNAVVSTPGIEEATPIAQGGNLVIDGKVSNATATISKTAAAYVDSVRASQDGTLLNLADVRFPATEATINFYMPGVVDGANIVAVQYINGEWVDVEVAEVRADHVTLNLKGNGVVAFIEK